jgi:hypothetical protein
LPSEKCREKLAFGQTFPKKDKPEIKTSYHFRGNVSMTLKFL